jgi:hypothetical protein
MMVSMAFRSAGFDFSRKIFTQYYFAVRFGLLRMTAMIGSQGCGQGAVSHAWPSAP